MFSVEQVDSKSIYQPIRWVTGRWIAGVVMFFALGGCAHHAKVASSDGWVLDVIETRQHFTEKQIQEIDSILKISNEMREQVTVRFSHLPKRTAAKKLAEWLIDESGHAMRYDTAANLTPIEAFEQRRGNCLSFTMLLNALAQALDIDIEFNSVDIPNTWGLDEQRGMMFYRHVNGVFSAKGVRQIFDLAMADYDSGYPQHYISHDQALALYYNNIALDYLAESEMQQAADLLKLAISLSPGNPDLWANLGVVMKRSRKLDLAESAFAYALQLDSYSIPAASNLERLYREQGNTAKAQTFKGLVARARRSNPYFHYHLALEDYSAKHYRGALKSTRRAIKLHNQDPRFYELKSRISQQQHNYIAAFKSLEKAYALAVGSEQRGKYLNKALMVSQRATDQMAKRWQDQNRIGVQIQMQGQ